MRASSMGIYGDSFACSHDESKHFAWYNLLAEKLNTTVYNYEKNTNDTYGYPASSTFFSYKKFIEYNDKHEYNIFIASAAGRYTKLVDLLREGVQVISGISSLEWYINDPNLKPGAKEQLERIRSWFLVSDDEYMHTAQELMLQDIDRKAEKNLIILAGDINETFCSKRKQNSCVDFGLWDLATLMYKEMGVTPETQKHVLNEKRDKISCHLSEPTNHMLADLLYNHIKTGEKITLPETIPHNHTWEYYYEIT